MLGVNKLLESLQRGMVRNVGSTDEIAGLSREERMAIGSWLVDAIKKAAKFDLGTYHKADVEPLRLTGGEQTRAGILSMPFPYTYVELKLIELSKKTSYIQNLYVPYNDISKIVSFDPKYTNGVDLSDAFVSFQFYRDGDELDLNFIAPVIGLDKSTGQIVMCSTPSIITLMKGVEFDWSEVPAYIQTHHAVLGIMLGLLTATGVEIDLEPAPERLNKARIAKGKLPAYEHHVVKIGGISSSGNVIGVGMDRASPRKHFRRGHTRTYHRGEDNEWKKSIPACVISGRGFVSKEYVNDNMGESDGKTKRS